MVPRIQQLRTADRKQKQNHLKNEADDTDMMSSDDDDVLLHWMKAVQKHTENTEKNNKNNLIGHNILFDFKISI